MDEEGRMRVSSPHHMTRPRPIRPKLSPIKFPGNYDNAYYTNYQYCTPPGGGKFNYYYQRNSYRSSGGYYSHFGSPAHSDSESGQMRDVVDSLNRKKKMSREVLFLQQQIYQEDQSWAKNEPEEYQVQDDGEGFYREDCHSAPLLNYYGYQYAPDKSRSPHFRRTPGAHRPPSRNCFFSGDRPSSSMSNRSSNSSLYGNFGFADPGAQFRPIRFGSPHHMSARDYADGGLDIEEDEPVTELMVSNLDYNISAREWRKILYAEFHQHVQVLDVHILTQPDNTNIGYIKVPTIEEARFAISQFHRKKIGYKRIHVTIVNHDENSMANAKIDVITLLKEVPNFQLSLYKLMELYEKRFHHPITASELYSFQDVLEIIEIEGQGRLVRLLPSDGSSVLDKEDISAEIHEDIVCSIHCSETSPTYQDMMESTAVPFVTQQLRSFSAQLHTLLQGHTGRLPLLSFTVCYHIEFGSLNIVPHGGVPLEHLISCVPGVHIEVSKTGVKHVQWAENKNTPSIEQARFCNSPLLNQQLAQFSREVVELLKQTPQCRLPFNKFIPMYHHTLGRQCRVADYGYTKLIELFDAIPHIVQVIGMGARKYVTLTHRTQMKRFALDIIRVLKSQASKQISVLDLPVVYNKVLAKPFDVTEYGLCYLEDILQELPENTITITGRNEEMVLSMPRRDQTSDELERTKQFALEVIDLLKHSPQCRMPFNRFIPAYHHHFGKQCRVSDYGFTKLVELFEAIPHVLKVVDELEDKVLTLVESELLKVLGEQVMALLKSCPDYKLPVPEFLLSFTKFHGHSLRLQDYGVTSVVELIEKIDRIAQVKSQEGRYIIKLVDHTHAQMLAHRILLLLMEQVDGAMILDTLQERYRQLFGYSLCDGELERDLEGIIQVSVANGKKTIKLSPLQMFARDARTLLRHHHGKLPLIQFDSAYANHFGVHLVPASYGYTSTTTLLQAIPHVVQLRGKAYNIIVLLCQDFQGKLFMGTATRSGPLLTDDDNELKDENHSLLDDGNLMDTSSQRSTPHDLLSIRVPSSVPSPELHPKASTMITPRDLMKFDSGGAIGVNELFSGLSPEEKVGQVTPLCKTPVSDMLQFAAQLLPVSPPPISGSDGSNYFYQYAHFPSHYSCMYNVPPVPSNAPHVATVEQQMSGMNYTKSLSFQSEEPPRYTTISDAGVGSIGSNVSFSTGLGNANVQKTTSVPLNLGKVGGTLFWMKTEDPNSSLHREETLDPNVEAVCESPVTSSADMSCNISSISSPVTSVISPVSNVISPETSVTSQSTNYNLTSPGLNLTSHQASTPTRQLDSTNESPQNPANRISMSEVDKSSSSESFHSPEQSPRFTIAEQLKEIHLSPGSETNSKEHDESQKAPEDQVLRDSGISSPGEVTKYPEFRNVDDLDGVMSTHSPNRKNGTPKRSRLAANFMANADLQ